MQSVVVRLRAELGLPELSTLHRLDRVTSGVLMLATEQRWRAPYQRLFERGGVRKTYRALAPWRADLELPVTVRNHIGKERGAWRAEVVPDAPVNAETCVDARVPRRRAWPSTGCRRAPAAPTSCACTSTAWASRSSTTRSTPSSATSRSTTSPDRCSCSPSELAFTDPVDGGERRFESVAVGCRF